MSGIGAIGIGGISSAWHQAYYYMNVTAARGAAANPARVELPVEPVDAVKPLAADGAIHLPVPVSEKRLPTVEDLNNASETLVRMRIQYPSSEPAIQTGAGIQDGLEGSSLPYGGSKQALSGVEKAKSPAEVAKEGECQTCAKRKYQDGSDDPGVSFKTPTVITPERAASAVRGHEQEHVVRERAEAQREGRKVVSQSVSIHTDICPECGRVYISGGTTQTVTANDNQSDLLFRQQKKWPGEKAENVA